MNGPGELVGMIAASFAIAFAAFVAAVPWLSQLAVLVACGRFMGWW